MSNQKCTGKSLFSEKNMGGHVEDYVGDPNNPTNYTKDLKWVPVSQSFKKMD